MNISRLPGFFIRDGATERLLESLGFVTMPDRCVVDTLKEHPDVISEPGSNWEVCATTEQAVGYTASSVTVYREVEQPSTHLIDWKVDYPELADD